MRTSDGSPTPIVLASVAQPGPSDPVRRPRGRWRVVNRWSAVAPRAGQRSAGPHSRSTHSNGPGNSIGFMTDGAATPGDDCQPGSPGRSTLRPPDTRGLGTGPA